LCKTIGEWCKTNFTKFEGTIWEEEDPFFQLEEVQEELEIFLYR
jgi:hypothetical protein